ncbi:MAG: TolC family protein [Alphaproteobacteria bacterium]|nr:TolC family protein [Alphaproteobacteria bacterium]
MKYVFSVLFALLPVVAMADENCATLRDVPDRELSIQEVVELGLCRNPQTASAYASLRAARFNKNRSYASYLPSASIGYSFSNSYAGSQFDDWSHRGPSISASYLLFDFGKRLADLNESLATYRATGFDYDETIQNYVYSVVGAYYELLKADADVNAATSALNVAKNANEMASKKFKAGAVAKADVYKSETTLAGSELTLERAKNNREIAKGALLTKLSFPADKEISIVDMSATFGSDAESDSIDELISIAQKKRPDLLRAAANKDAAWHRRNASFLKNLPSISANASMGWDKNTSYGVGAPQTNTPNGTIGISISMPIFAGFANMYGVRSANASYDAAIESERNTSNNAMMDVFTAYQNYKTARTVLKQTESLLKSATESERVTSGMYKVGRATMLDWQTSQNELVDAQKQNNAAKYDLYVKRAAVALAIGDIKSELGDE